MVLLIEYKPEKKKENIYDGENFYLYVRTSIKIYFYIHQNISMYMHKYMLDYQVSRANCTSGLSVPHCTRPILS